ncbi:MAG: hypothetical protein A2Y17_04675 [Clostridiales bacterium GWF2_38_85]|nr:MAG: hypothetical protein A2Y17_04675 [Clostridiales bacterium GWF2_38_85]
MLTHTGTQTIQTERLLLRRFTIDDAQAMFDNWATDVNVIKYMHWDLHKDMNETRFILNNWITEYEKPSCYNWVIVYEGMPVGAINLHALSDTSMRSEIGYNIGSKWWNIGITTEATRAVIGFAFNNLNMHRIAALHLTTNVASGRVMQKSGMTYEGTMRKHALRKDGVFEDMCIYGILKDEWENAHQQKTLAEISE